MDTFLLQGNLLGGKRLRINNNNQSKLLEQELAKVKIATASQKRTSSTHWPLSAAIIEIILSSSHWFACSCLYETVSGMTAPDQLTACLAICPLYKWLSLWFWQCSRWDGDTVFLCSMYPIITLFPLWNRNGNMVFSVLIAALAESSPLRGYRGWKLLRKCVRILLSMSGFSELLN